MQASTLNSPPASCEIRDPGEIPGRATSKSLSLEPEHLIILGTLGFAAAGQGGYYLGPRIVIMVALAAAGAVHLLRSHHAGRFWQPFVLALAALSAWVTVNALRVGHPAAALAPLSVLGGLGVVTIVVGRASRDQRRRIAGATIAVGACLAMSGWMGVAFRISRWASPQSGLWRATTAVTYSNAAAAVMAALAILALAMLVDRPSPLRRVAAMLLILGVAATLSRAGIIGLVVGFCIVLGVLGVQRAVKATTGSVVGAVVAAFALTRGMPVASSGRPGWAIAGLLVGTFVALLPTITNRRVTRLAIAVLAFALLGSGVVVAARVLDSTTGPSGWSERISASSSSRVQEARAAIRLIRAHPLAGTGPGQATFIWSKPGGQLVVDSYAHDEYLQLAAEEGLIGVALLLLLMATVAGNAVSGSRVLSGIHDGDRAIWVGATVGLIYLAGHSGVDFLWHVPVVIVVAAILVGLSGPPPPADLPISPQLQPMESS